MRLKNSKVNPNIHPAFWEPLYAVDEFWRDAVGYEFVMTSGRDNDPDNPHMEGSRHAWGGAVDQRTWDGEHSGRQLMGRRREALCEMVAEIMGDDFQVIDEHNHFHIEYQPEYPE